MRKKSNGQNFSQPKKRAAQTKDYRFFVVAAVFTVLMIAFLVSVMIVQSKGPKNQYSDDDLRTFTVSGERGRIFDCNGELLVGNSVYYDFIFEYGAMAYSAREVNDALLDCLKALASSDLEDKRATDYFVLKGTYPNVAFVEGIGDTSKNVGYFYDRFLVRNELKSELSSAEFAQFFVKKYKLDKFGYTNKEITQLIRIYYDMDRVGFGAYQSYTIAKGFMPSDAEDMAFISAVEERRIEGASFVKRFERVYYYGDYARNLLGSIGLITKENAEEYIKQGYSINATVGNSGCEKTFESYLRGVDGKRVMKYDKQKNLVEEYYDPAPVVGNDIYLTIDIKLQIAAEDALVEQVEELKHSEAGAATVTRADTGEVLAIASYSTYTSTNLALYGLFAPGSTYKIGTALAALELKHINSGSTYLCTKECNFGPDCLGNHGNIAVSDAIAVSCNMFFDYLGIELGLDQITPYTQKLGLGVPTGIELGDAAGAVASEAYAETLDNYVWRQFDDASGAIGQSLHQYTPLQLSVYMGAVVNNGTRYSAHILKSVNARNGEVISAVRPDVANTLTFSASTYNILMGGMRKVITSSSVLSSYFADIDVAVGGKTGTAETGKAYDNALFSGFAPFEEPDIVATCVLEQGEAGNNAAKVVAAIFEAYFAKEEE